jgi:hypothetical protein
MAGELLPRMTEEPMAVVLVAIFPIVLLINSQVAWLGISLGILLLYRDLRRETGNQVVRGAAAARRTPSARRPRRLPTQARIKSQAMDAMSRA